MTYPLAPDAVYWTIQGEGILSGVPMGFIRFAGCPVGCPECDTDYRTAYRLTVAEIIERLQRLPRVEWVWLTGGEPTIHNITPVVAALHGEGYRVALATAGINPVQLGQFWGGVDFVSVSPHRIDESWVVRRGDQLNIVAGLNGLRLTDVDGVDVSGFNIRYVTPCNNKPETLQECVSWVKSRPGWRLNIQAHKIWGLP